MKYDGRLYTQAEVDAMNNTPKTVESLINEAETKWASQGRTDEQKWAVRNFITGSMQEAMTTSKNQTDEPVEKRQDNPDVLWVMINARDKLIREYERRLKVVEDFANVMKDYQRDED